MAQLRKRRNRHLVSRQSTAREGLGCGRCHLRLLMLRVEALGLLAGPRPGERGWELNMEASRLTECFLPQLWVPGPAPCT